MPSTDLTLPAGALPARLDRIRQALTECRTDQERLRVRDHARALRDAAAILNRRDIQTEASILVADAERLIGKANPPLPVGNSAARSTVARDDGSIPPSTLRDIRQAHRLDDDAYEAVKATAVETQEPITRRTLLSAGAAARRETLNEAARSTPPAAGTFQCIVIDPPWPMKFIRRDVRPDQWVEPYATMTLDEIRSVAIPKAGACHLWLWTTQRFLLDAHELAGAWGFKPLAVITWCKPGGFQPAGLPQFTSEYLLLARRGGLAFDDTKGFSTWYQWPRGAHSEKPEAAYDLIRRVSPGPRIDMFSRREIDGFEAWGAEA